MVDNNALCNIISNTIYIACKDSYKDTRHQDVPDIEPNLINCNSENFKAIAHANLTKFDILSGRGYPEEECVTYLKNWVKFENMAMTARNREINTKINKSWKGAKGDSKKIWAMVDWKGKADKDDDDKIDEEETAKYFSQIFQSAKTKHHPVITDELITSVESYNVQIPLVDHIPSMNKVEYALKTFGNGVGTDRITASVINLFQLSLKEIPV